MMHTLPLICNKKHLDSRIIYDPVETRGAGVYSIFFRSHPSHS